MIVKEARGRTGCAYEWTVSAVPAAEEVRVIKDVNGSKTPRSRFREDVGQSPCPWLQCAGNGWLQYGGLYRCRVAEYPIQIRPTSTVGQMAVVYPSPPAAR